MQDQGDDEQRAERDARADAIRTVVLVRLIAGPLLTLGAFLQAGAHVGAIAACAAVAALHLALSSWALLRRRCDPPSRLLLLTRAGDLLIVATAIASSDPDRPALALLGLLAVLLSPSLLAPRTAMALEAAFALCLVVLTLVHDLDDGSSLRDTATVLIAWALILGVSGISGRIGRQRLQRLGALASDRQALLGATAARAESERREVSRELHDGVLQTLLAAGQDLDAAAHDGHADDVARARELVRTSVEALREAVVEMHPSSLTGAALPQALGALVAHHRERGARIEADIDPGASGAGDEELYAVGRELLANVTGRPRVGVVRVRLWREDGEARLEVVREGGGAAPGSRVGDTAIATVGIAWTAERLRRAGGGLRLDLEADAPGRGLAWAPLQATSRPSTNGSASGS